MSREQADQVALAVDRPGDPYTGYLRGGLGNANPFENATFMKNCIASGSIVPPHGEGDRVRRVDFIVGYIVLMLLGMGAIFIVTALVRW